MRINKINFSRPVILFLVSVALANTVFPHEKTWPEKRLRQAWPEAQSFTSKQFTLTSGQISELKSEGIQIGSEDRNPTFYFAQKKETPSDTKAKTLGIILFIDASGENGSIEISVAMGTDGQVKKADIWEHSENSLVAKENFLKQFVGKNSKDTFIISKDYTPIAGAEKSSEAVARAVKKALKISNAIFAKK